MRLKFQVCISGRNQLVPSRYAAPGCSRAPEQWSLVAMLDPWNPTVDEVRDWAFDLTKGDPCEDWDLALSWSGYESAYLDFAADDSCPKRTFFLHLLYLMVGDAVRQGYRARSEEAVLGFVGKATGYIHPDIALWSERCQRLIADPSSFDYEFWCGGGFLRAGS